MERVFEGISKNGKKVAVFGGGHYTTAFLAYLGLSKYISFVIDDDENKVGYRLPLNQNIKIYKSNFLDKGNIDICLLGLNPAHHEKILRKHQNFCTQGGKFYSIFPGSPLDILSSDL
jgi:pyrroline-5-carboxylate reductase